MLSQGSQQIQTLKTGGAERRDSADMVPAMSARNWGLLLSAVAAVGQLFFFYKVLVAVLPPVTVVLGRVGIAAVAMNLWLLARGQRCRWSRALWARFLLLGLLNNVIPFILIAWGETRIAAAWRPSSMPPRRSSWWWWRIWAPTTRNCRRARSPASRWASSASCVLVGPDALAGNGQAVGELAVIGASCVYAFGGVYSRRFKACRRWWRRPDRSAAPALILLPLSLAVDHPWTLPMPGWQVWASLLAIALVNTALGLFRLLQDAGDGGRHLHLAGDLPHSASSRCCWARWSCTKASRCMRWPAWRSSRWDWRRSTGG